MDVIQVNRPPEIVSLLPVIQTTVNQPFNLSVSDSFRDPDHDELTLGLMATNNKTLPDWLQLDVDRGLLTGVVPTAGHYHFMFANDTSQAQARMPFSLVATSVTRSQECTVHRWSTRSAVRDL